MTDNNKKGFNPDFYATRELEVTKKWQTMWGCFNCGNRNEGAAKKTCSACNIAVYCNRKCQRDCWKGNHGGAPHSRICKEMCAFKSRKLGPLPILVNNYPGMVSNDVIEAEMRNYGDLFIEEAARSLRTKYISLQVLCFEDNYNIVRLVGTAMFGGGGGPAGAQIIINRVLFYEVDRGITAGRNVEPSDGTSGSISKQAKKRVVTHIADFVVRLRSKGIGVMSICYGRGLMWLSEDDDDAKRVINSANGGSVIIWTPDSHYVMKDSLASATFAAFGF